MDPASSPVLSQDDGFENMDGSPASIPVEESQDTPISKDVTVGIRQLKDAAADVGWQNDNQTNGLAFSNTVQIGGITMNKSKAIMQQFRYVTSASSTDRLRRVAQESRFKNSHRLDTSISDKEGPVLSVLQPITTLVLCEQKLFLCIAEVNGLFHDSLPVDDIPIAVLSEKIIQVSYQALRLVPASTTDNPNGIYDWRSSHLFSLSAKVPGALVQPINPTIASHIPCNSFFLFETSSLMAIVSNLRDRVIHGHRKAIPHVKASDIFPYQEQHSESLLLVRTNDLIIYQGEHALLWRSPMPMNMTRSMSGWLVRSASPPSISIHRIGIVSLSTSGHISFMTPLWTAAPNHADCAFAQHRSAKLFLRK
jgi:hypothetical protein